LLAKENVKNSEAQLQSTEKQLEYSEARKSAGIISRADYLNIKSQYATENAALVISQSDLRLTLVSIMQLMNMPANETFDITAPDIQTLLAQPTEANADKIFNISKDINPEIKTAELELVSARTGINIAKAEALPILTLTASLANGYNNNLSGIGLGEQMANQISPAIKLSLSVPIFQRKQVKNQVAQATIQADNYQYNLIDIKNDLRKAIEQACLDARTAYTTFLASQGQCEAEQESYRLAKEMFAQGLLNSADFLTAKNNLIEAENSLTQTKYNVALQNKIIDYYLGKPITF
jgi:outer membrane protein